MSTIPGIVEHRARTDPDGRAYVFLDDHGEESATVTYAALQQRSVRVAAELRRHCRPGDRALLVFGQSPHFVSGYLACLYSGVLAVPVAPARRGGPSDVLDAIVTDCAPTVVLTESGIGGIAGSVERTTGSLPRIVVDELTPAAVPDPGAPLDVVSNDVAFLQYTSGSTSDPKGVMVTHGNLMANQEMIRHAFGHDQHSTVVGWAPFFHDQGLIGNLMQPLYVGATAVMMSPGAFIRRPLLWLRTIDRYRAHTSGGPNFAYDACVARAATADLTGLDLSSWTVAFNGAEPIRPDTLDRFAETFAPYGFRGTAHFPCYGLAEATLLVSASRAGRGPKAITVDPDRLRDRNVVGSTASDAVGLVGSGTLTDGTGVVIVDPDSGRRCRDGDVGEIWVSGPQVAQGYWRNQAATAHDFGNTLDDGSDVRYLRTGDLGALVGDELYVVGRVTDMVIIRGKNHHPHDIEDTAQRAHRSIRPGGCAAFSVAGATGETLVVVAEIAAEIPEPDPDAVAEAIRGAVTTRHQVSARHVVITIAGTLEKTTSGKIRRSAARARYLGHGFPAVTR
ncbi:hypothetical protein GCM10007298_27840 [Williamsia phyllosphaerae]|uniref:Acyl-CoA synthetase (AMP-forming)/AMP-acid ligase II n=1 Tax=Williamsia phyllosphaerae TaxID=885042 RepID=A0ABQ1UYS9_9NOCA|nr:hypothetical protein GCM10007298_27840 [Williamsia phyllosphaerae]